MLVYIQCIVLLQGFLLDIQRFPASSWAIGSPSTSIGWRAKWPYGLIGWWDASCHLFFFAAKTSGTTELKNQKKWGGRNAAPSFVQWSARSWPRAGAFTEIGTKPSFAETSSRSILRLLGSLAPTEKSVMWTKRTACLGSIMNLHAPKRNFSDHSSTHLEVTDLDVPTITCLMACCHGEMCRKLF